MKCLRVIGVGSPFGADRLGWALIERLRNDAELSRRQALDLLKADRPGSALIEMMQGADHVILVDALRGGHRPGEVLWLSPGALDRESGLYSSHGFGLADALALGEALGALPGRIDIAAFETPGDICESDLNALSASVKTRIISVLKADEHANIHDDTRVNEG